MRWGKAASARRAARFRKHLWFAWHPVRVYGEWVWLEHVGRKRHSDEHGGWWNYSPVPDPLSGED